MHDAQWVLGPNTSSIDFRNTSPVNDSIPKWMATRETNAATCDAAGNLLYYTNGVYIAGALSNGDSILNGNGLSPCASTTQYSGSGLPIPQGALFLNKPGSDRYYYLFHFSLDNGVAYTLYNSIIDREGNFGLGEVIVKNDTFYQGITRTGGMTACKHANGRDWWIVIGGRNNNLYRKFLLTPDGITDTLLQNIGPNFMGPADNSYSRFSLDGSKYVTGAYVGLITVMDFDRCNGEFSNPITISNKVEGFTAPGISSVEFSPNGELIYAATTADLKQYDLSSSNLQDSIILYQSSPIQNAGIDMIELAYDGKIYASCFVGGFGFMHTINSPDVHGVGCSFVYAGQPTYSGNTINVSNTANPRLGPLVGSGCDTIISDLGKSIDANKPRIQPNPADKFMYIEMPAQGIYIFELTNEQGRMLERRETKQVDIINTEDLPSGVYYLRVASREKHVSTEKVVVRH